MTFSEEIDPRMFVNIELAHTLTLGVLQRFYKLVRKARGKDIWLTKDGENLAQVPLTFLFDPQTFVYSFNEFSFVCQNALIFAKYTSTDTC